MSGQLIPYMLDLQQFRAALVALQQQVDDLDGLKGSHYQEILEAEDEVRIIPLTPHGHWLKDLLQLWSGVLAKTVFVARAEMDVYDKIACAFGILFNGKTRAESVPLLSQIHGPLVGVLAELDSQSFRVLGSAAGRRATIQRFISVCIG